MSAYHQTVMGGEVVSLLACNGLRGGVFLDVTLGGGGHAELLLESHPDVSVVGMDQDSEAIAEASRRLQRFGSRCEFIQGNFRDVKRLLVGREFQGAVMDLGVSSHQIDSAERGFSFLKPGPLDMRMDPRSKLTAADIINCESEAELARVFWEYGDERCSRKIARAIVDDRKIRPFRKTQDLADLVSRLIRGRPGGIHPATRVFQALRIAVNDELQVLNEGLVGVWEMLVRGGRMAVISFHSLEDRMVKHQFRNWAQAGVGNLLTKKPLEPREDEVFKNKRSRSAKLRVIEKGDFQTDKFQGDKYGKKSKAS